jgi:hypothetical protein
MTLQKPFAGRKIGCNGDVGCRQGTRRVTLNKIPVTQTAALENL